MSSKYTSSIIQRFFKKCFSGWWWQRVCAKRCERKKIKMEERQMTNIKDKPNRTSQWLQEHKCKLLSDPTPCFSSSMHCCGYNKLPKYSRHQTTVTLHQEMWAARPVNHATRNRQEKFLLADINYSDTRRTESLFVLSFHKKITIYYVSCKKRKLLWQEHELLLIPCKKKRHI